MAIFYEVRVDDKTMSAHGRQDRALAEFDELVSHKIALRQSGEVALVRVIEQGTTDWGVSGE